MQVLAGRPTALLRRGGLAIAGSAAGGAGAGGNFKLKTRRSAGSSSNARAAARAAVPRRDQVIARVTPTRWRDGASHGKFIAK